MSRNKEFFEVFRKPSPGETPPQQQRPVSVGLPKASVPGSKVVMGPGSSSRSPTVYTISQPALISICASAVVLVIIAFFAGHYTRGGAQSTQNAPPAPANPLVSGPRSVTPQPSPPPVAERQDEPSLPNAGGAAAKTGVHWELVIVSGGTEEGSKELVGFLKERNISARALRDRLGYSVLAGEFESQKSPEATAFQDKVESLEYKGKKKAFKDSMWKQFERKD
jgi:hypothetical protein